MNFPITLGKKKQWSNKAPASNGPWPGAEFGVQPTKQQADTLGLSRTGNWWTRTNTPASSVPTEYPTRSGLGAFSAPADVPTQTGLFGKIASGLANKFSDPTFVKALGQAGAAISGPNVRRVNGQIVTTPSRGQMVGQLGAQLAGESAYDTVTKKLAAGENITDIPESSALTPDQLQKAMSLQEGLTTSRYKRTDDLIKRLKAIDTAPGLTEEQRQSLTQELITSSGLERRKVEAMELGADADMIEAEGASDLYRSRADATAPHDVQHGYNVAEIEAKGKQDRKTLAMQGYIEMGIEKERTRRTIEAAANASGIAINREDRAKLDQFMQVEKAVRGVAADSIKLNYPGDIVQALDGTWMISGQSKLKDEITREYTKLVTQGMLQRISTGQLPNYWLGLLPDLDPEVKSSVVEEWHTASNRAGDTVLKYDPKTGKFITP